MNNERDEMLEQFIKEYPEVIHLMEHYPKQAKYLWEIYKYDKKAYK